MNTMQFEEAAQVTVAEFLQLLAANDLDYWITWYWVGQVRHGTIHLTEKQPNPYATRVKLDSQTYTRTSTQWGTGDATLGRLRTGSPKHRAVQRLTLKLHLMFEAN